MTNQEIAAQFRDMAAQYINAAMFRQAADRLEAMDGLLAACKAVASIDEYSQESDYEAMKCQCQQAIAEAEKNL